MRLCYFKGFLVLYIQRSLSLSLNPQFELELAWVFSPFPLLSFLVSSLRCVCVGEGTGGGVGVDSPFPRWFYLFSNFPNQKASISKSNKHKSEKKADPTLHSFRRVACWMTLKFLLGRISGMRKVLVGWK